MADEATALDILASQKRYYDMRADRESEWLGSSGDWDYGVEQNLAWERERDAIAQRLESSVGPAIRLLEIAAGTGGWSSTIALQGAGLAIVTDTSERALALNPGVRRGETIKVLADAFVCHFGQRVSIVSLSHNGSAMCLSCVSCPSSAASRRYSVRVGICSS